MNKIILKDIRVLTTFKNLFNDKFLKENENRLEICFYSSSSLIMGVLYEYDTNKNIMFGFFAGGTKIAIAHYDDYCNPLPSKDSSHYDFIEINDNIEESKINISNRIFELFGVSVQL